MVTDLSNIDSPAEDIFERIQEQTNEIILENQEQSEVYLMGSTTEEILRQRAENPLEIPGLAMNWANYDKVTQGQSQTNL